MCRPFLVPFPQLHLVEIYADGKLTKRMRRADQKRERVHWRIVASPQPNPEAAALESAAAEQPPPLHGHAMARVGSAIFMYGGVTHTADGKEVRLHVCSLFFLGGGSGFRCFACESGLFCPLRICQGSHQLYYHVDAILASLVFSALVKPTR
jgi:hypothetical protein